MPTTPNDTRSYADVMRSGTPVLTDAATGTRLRFGSPWHPDEHIGPASFATSPERARVMRTVFTGYATVARDFGLPIVLYAPTSRATRDRMRRSATWHHPSTPARQAPSPAETLNRRCVELVRDARRRVPGVEAFVAGVVGPAGDAYRADTAPSAAAARAIHRPHAQALADAGVDLLVAAPFPSVSEAAGAACAMADTSSDYVVALVLGSDADVVDGTPLGEAVDRIDAATDRPPLHYLIQCVHPRLAGAALQRLARGHPGALARVRGVKANAADASLADLDGAATLRGDEPEPWARELMGLREQYGLTVLGGCCGTDERHLLSLALRLAGTPN